jgi:formylmethanofuran dehydrogenase subunit E
MDDELYEVAARAVNAEPWEPLPGMMKRKCSECRYFFATPKAALVALCPDCAGKGTRPQLST